ncbi:MAG TPA: tRNA (N6-threonylcarbamoyladenosine(37)-N6)-methyltransferase TrmO [Syntrophomonas sp.]|nr:tRNA (N6-threonylcarbamoyladenosine(37)-N6)-methyltransferase TrmO [Syntrophomonas sp.]
MTKPEKAGGYMELKPIGIIHSPYKEKKDSPRQGRFSDNLAVIEVFDEYTAGLKNVETLTNLFVLYWGDRSDRNVLQSVTPFGPEITGVFSSRSPNRPNPIALCIVDVISVEGNKLTVRGLDALDGSPLLDIKAYSGSLDSIPDAQIGWQSSKDDRPEKANGGDGLA